MYKKILAERFAHKTICLLGYGREGQSSRQIIQSLLPRAHIGIADQKLNKNYLKTLKNYDVIIRSPGVPLSLIEPFIRPNTLITSQTKLFFEFCPGIIIGVTGTKGKSTIVSLIHHVLKPSLPQVQLIGNIGTPPLPLLDQATKSTVFVFELSSHQLLDLTQSPHIAVLLNLFPEHLDYYANFDAYVAAKANITRYQTSKDILVYNPADPAVLKIAQESKAQKYPFQVKPNHQLPSLDAAIVVGGLFNIPEAKINHQLKTFSPLPHRLEPIGTFRQITFINDSLATIPQATIHALRVTGVKLSTLITGGFDRGVDYQPLAQAILESPIHTLILLPDTGAKIKQSLIRLNQSISDKINIIEVNSMSAAVKAAYQFTPKGKICLLSPAAASFNLFRDYQDRGEQFTYRVNQYRSQLNA
ncbi:MAG: hypothetical protein HY381_02785 [Candidatus Chisholmbacteria bacterium]|nr:hypothetical protein [Candidatus Chisholmbacteria bacterium]